MSLPLTFTLTAPSSFAVNLLPSNSLIPTAVAVFSPPSFYEPYSSSSSFLSFSSSVLNLLPSLPFSILSLPSFFCLLLLSPPCRVLVGAPLDNMTNHMSGEHPSGALYSCPITMAARDCQQILMLKPMRQYGIKNIHKQQWLGVNVHSDTVYARGSFAYVSWASENERFSQQLELLRCATLDS